MKTQCSVILHAHVSFIAVKFQVLCKLPRFAHPVSVLYFLVLVFEKSLCFQLPSAPCAVVLALPSSCVHVLPLEQTAWRFTAFLCTYLEVTQHDLSSRQLTAGTLINSVTQQYCEHVLYSLDSFKYPLHTNSHQSSLLFVIVNIFNTIKKLIVVTTYDQYGDQLLELENIHSNFSMSGPHRSCVPSQIHRNVKTGKDF